MARHQFQQDQWLPVSLDEAWTYFSNPANLTELTPPALGMELVGEVGEMHVGQILRHRVRVMRWIPMLWVSEITAVDPGRGFVDEQRRGPFAFWRHQHILAPDGVGVRVTDLIDYSAGFGPIGDLANILYLRGHLRRTFAFRRSVLETKFC